MLSVWRRYVLEAGLLRMREPVSCRNSRHTTGDKLLRINFHIGPHLRADIKQGSGHGAGAVR